MVTWKENSVVIWNPDPDSESEIEVSVGVKSPEKGMIYIIDKLSGWKIQVTPNEINELIQMLQVTKAMMEHGWM